jgi:2-dehydropantoate 2-reductase
VVAPDEDAARRGTLLTPRPVGDQRRMGGSTWQSLTRATGSVETDYLSGEIVLLGRLMRFPTPINERLQVLANEMAIRHEPPGSMTVAEVLAPLE